VPSVSTGTTGCFGYGPEARVGHAGGLGLHGCACRARAGLAEACQACNQNQPRFHENSTHTRTHTHTHTRTHTRTDEHTSQTPARETQASRCARSVPPSPPTPCKHTTGPCTHAQVLTTPDAQRSFLSFFDSGEMQLTPHLAHAISDAKMLLIEVRARMCAA